MQRRTAIVIGGVVAATIVIAAVSVAFSTTLQQNSQISGVQIAPIDSSPKGKSYSEWSMQWWKWALGTPVSNSAVADNTGSNCLVNQEQMIQDEKVVFLAGAQGTVERRCTIPADTMLVIPLVNLICEEKADGVSGEALANCPVPYVDQVQDLTFAVDNFQYPREELRKHRVATGAFDIDLVNDNIYGWQPGKTQASADGYYVIIEGLSEGQHTVKLGGNIVHRDLQFANEVTYHLTVGEPS